jgi:putative aldouronate transport system permease protein
MSKNNFIKISLGEKLFNVFNILILCAFCLTIVYPFLNMIAISLSGNHEVLRNEVTFYPKAFTWVAYKEVANNALILRAYLNTIIVALACCVLSLVLTSMAAYPLAYSDFIGKKVYNLFIVITLWFSAGMVPHFMVIRSLGLLDNLFSLVISGALGAYNVVILRNFFHSLPISMVESAKIDGANEFTILFRIIMPLSKPALATIALWVIVGQWNNYMAPLMYLRTKTNYTLQIVLRDIVLATEGDIYGIRSENASLEGGVTSISEQIKNAVLVFSMIPMLIIYPFIQKYFVKGIMLGAVKE